LRQEAFRLLTGRAAVAGEAERTLRAWQGEGAAEHVILTASGLDSACVGETEIAGQVRQCHERALQAGLAGPRLGLVFDEALRVAGRVRSTTRLGQGRTSLAEIAAQLIRERIVRTPGQVALVGVSPMTERAATSLHEAGLAIVVVNRKPAKAAALAERCGGNHQDLETFRRDPPPVEAVLSATGAGAPIFDTATLEHLALRSPSGQPPLVVDMAVPGDFDAQRCTRLGIPRIGLDEIVRRAEEGRAARIEAAAPARELVDRALDELRGRLTDRACGPLFTVLQQRYERTAREGLARLMKKELSGIGEGERVAVERWLEVLARRFAHIPCVGLRGLLRDGPDGALDAFFSGLEPEFADELRATLETSLDHASPTVTPRGGPLRPADGGAR
jgi:glutamyl-tRNA reductase